MELEFGNTAASQLVPGTLRGYRLWIVTEEGNDAAIINRPVLDDPSRLRLRSVSYAYAWDPAKKDRHLAHCYVAVSPMSVFTGDEERAPAVGSAGHNLTVCTCGFYAYLKPKGLFQPPVEQYLPTGLRTLVFGTIRASGLVTIGKMGFRAQYAQLEALAPYAHSTSSWIDYPIVTALANTYGTLAYPSGTDLQLALPSDDLSSIITEPGRKAA